MGFIIYFIIILLIPLYFQWRVTSTYKKYSKVRSTSNLTGKEVAEYILQSKGIYDVSVERGEGFLSDYYDSKNKKIVLSPSNYDTASVSGTAVASHECGHAIQDAVGYKYMSFRSALFPLANIGSNLSFYFILAGMIITIFSASGIGDMLLLTGIVLFTFAVMFQLVTLPVEFDASKRAMDIIVEDNIVEGKEIRHAKKVLKSASMTYVASTAVALLELVRLIMIYQSE